MRNIQIIDNGHSIELWVDGECITDCFDRENATLVEFINELGEFGRVPIFKPIERIP